MNTKPLTRLLPFVLALAIVAIDQLTKALVVANIPLGTIHSEVIGDFLRIIHVRNLGIAFSIGGTAPGILRTFLFHVFPTILMLGMIVYSLRSKQLSTYQRWVLAGIVGGGIGNLIDRWFRPEGVVDFIDVKFYGLFGLERWPTFNVADSAVVVCGILLAINIFLYSKDAA